MTILRNEIKNCDEGIHIEDGSSGNIIHCNNIFGNTIGLNNTSGVLVDAEKNWWGDPSGPSGVGPGSGDAVSINVDYDPWAKSYPACAPVGGVWTPINKFGLLAPWISLASFLAITALAVSVIFVKRRKNRNL